MIYDMMTMGVQAKNLYMLVLLFLCIALIISAFIWHIFFGD